MGSWSPLPPEPAPFDRAQTEQVLTALHLCLNVSFSSKGTDLQGREVPEGWLPPYRQIIAILTILLFVIAIALVAVSSKTGNWGVAEIGVGIDATILVSLIVYFRTQWVERQRSTPGLSGSGELSREVLGKYYSDSVRYLWDPGGRRASQSLMYDFSGAPLRLDFVHLEVLQRAYQLPEQLKRLSKYVSDTKKRAGVQYKPKDPNGVVVGVRQVRGNSELAISVERGLMSHEYTTIQNPEMSWVHLGWDRSGTVNPDTVREYFKIKARTAFAGQSLVPLTDTPLPGGVYPAYRLAAHAVLLLWEPREIPWLERSFFLQVRPTKGVATGAGEVTSSVGAGIDWKDVDPPSRNARQGAPVGDTLFREFILRELRAEVYIQRHEIQRLGLVALTRDVERLGQPVAILLGETTLSISVLRWRKEHPIIVRVFGGGGKERWESTELRMFRIGDIPSLLRSDKVQSGTKSCLYFLSKFRGANDWNARIPRLEGPPF